MLRLTRCGPEFAGTAVELEHLRTEFERQNLVRVPGFLAPPLLKLIQGELEQTGYQKREQVTGTELRPVDTTPYYALELLMNSPTLFTLIQELTGCGRIACFAGRIYRRLPSPEYYQRWHTDVAADGRMVAVTINLSTEVYQGGVLQLRDAATEQLLCQADNTGPGDAIIFRIDPSLQHRITPVEGDYPKTAMAGWFKSKPEARSLFARGRPPSTHSHGPGR